MGREDLRIIRTRKTLCNTLLSMMEEQSIEKISVIDLCQRSMINRATFYAHFEDKYHLLTFALEELKDNIYGDFTKDVQLTTPSMTITSILKMAIDFFFAEHSHISNLLQHNRNGRVISSIQDSIAQSIKYQLTKYKDTYDVKVPITMLSNFIAGGMMSTVVWCLDNPTRYTREDFIRYVNNTNTTHYFTKR